MKKVKTTHGYDIYEMSQQDCEKHGYLYPTFSVFFSAEEADIALEEASFGTLSEAVDWCECYSRNYCIEER